MSWRGAGLEEGLVWEGQSGDPLVPAGIPRGASDSGEDRGAVITLRPMGVCRDIWSRVCLHPIAPLPLTN